MEYNRATDGAHCFAFDELETPALQAVYCEKIVTALGANPSAEITELDMNIAGSENRGVCSIEIKDEDLGEFIKELRDFQKRSRSEAAAIVGRCNIVAPYAITMPARRLLLGQRAGSLAQDILKNIPLAEASVEASGETVVQEVEDYLAGQINTEQDQQDTDALPPPS